MRFIIESGFKSRWGCNGVCTVVSADKNAVHSGNHMHLICTENLDLTIFFSFLFVVYSRNYMHLICTENLDITIFFSFLFVVY